MAFNTQLQDYLLKLFGNQPMEPMATAANAALAYRARPEGMELISDAGGPPPTALPPQLPPVAPPQAPQAALPAPRPIAAPSPAPSLPAQPVAPLSGKYDDNARQALYDDLAQRRRGNAGWEAIANVADMNTRVGGGTPINANAGMVEQRNLNEKTAKGDFEAGRTALVGEHERAVTAQDKRDAIKAALEQKDLDRQTRSEDRRYLADAAKSQKDIQLSMKQDQFNEGLTSKLRTQLQSHPAYKNYLTIKGATDQARKAVQNPSAYGDLSLIYSTIKGLDAQSAVREGEVSLMREMASLKDRAGSYLGTLTKGQTLTASQKQDVMKVLDRMNAIAKDNLEFTAAPILNQGRRANLKEDEINPLYEAPKAGPAGSQERKARIAQLRAELGK